MLNRSITFFVDNKFVVFVTILLVIIFGVVTSPFGFGLNFIPKNPVSVDAIPNIGENQQVVFTEWTGQSPQDIEDQITYPLSSHLLGVPGVKSVRGSSMFGFSSIYIIFQDDIDFYWSRSRILEKLSALPKNLLPSNVQPRLGPDATALGQIFWYTLEGRNENGEVTGGWNLQELRSIQDFYVKNALASTEGVSEVASVGGYVKEYQIDVNPELMKQYGISLNQVVQAVKDSNQDIGAQTIEINKAEYFVRGLGYIKSLRDIENTSVISKDFTSINIRDIANVSMGPAERRGILDKGGAEVVGGVVTSRFGENPMKVSINLKNQIKEISHGLPKKQLANGTISQLTIVPFYDRSVFIDESLKTLRSALFYEILIAILVVLIVLRSIKVSFLVSILIPLVVLSVFITMRLFAIEANIVALSGIAIAIGTIVDMSIILTENMIRHRDENPNQKFSHNILNATKEVSGAILTAGLTTIISFIPVFSLTGAEGKLFMPLAFTKSIALFSSMIIALFLIPPIATFFLKPNQKANRKSLFPFIVSLIGILSMYYNFLFGFVLLVLGLIGIAYYFDKIDSKILKTSNLVVIIFFIALLLGIYWRPLGFNIHLLTNIIFIIIVVVLVILPFYYFVRYYENILRWVLSNKKVSVSLPIVAIILGFLTFSSVEKEFMPKMDEGQFLLMPTSLPHSGIEENNRVLKSLDMAVNAIPEVDYVIGKAGRVESALDPAPLSMYENMISYKTEYIENEEGELVRFSVDEKGYFKTKSGNTISSGSSINFNDLIPDKNGEYYRNWRNHIKNSNDIWDEIIKATKLPGITSAPKLQPIETRLVMLQTGMRSNLGIKIKGKNLADIENFSRSLEEKVKTIPGILPESVYADRITGKPYLLLEIDREKASRYGLSIATIQQTLAVAIGGKLISETIEGRERYNIRVRYPRELRGSPEDIESVYLNLVDGGQLPLKEIVNVKYEKGPQSIRSEDGFLVGYLIFDKEDKISEVTAVKRIEAYLTNEIQNDNLKIPTGVNYQFSGTYESHIRAQNTLSLVIPVVLLIIFLVLYLQFRSISVSLMVFSGITVAFAGGFFLLWLYGQSWFFDFSIFGVNLRDLFNIQTINLSVAVWVGFIALFGISTDDGVVMATYLNQSFNSNKPDTIMAIRTSVIEAGKKRIRPCLMTTATTILALIPILTSSGKGSSIMIPMAIPCLGGMLMALITLFIVPLLYCWRKEVILNKV